MAWVQEDRFGVAFNEEIDPKIARAPLGQGLETVVNLLTEGITARPDEKRR